MEQTIEELKDWLDLSIDALANDRGLEITNLNDDPLYEECKTYVKTINYLIEATYEEKYMNDLKIEPLDTLIDNFIRGNK